MTEMYVIFYISCLPFYYSIFLLVEFRGSPFWHLCRRWRYRALSLQLTVLPVTAGLLAWCPFCFQRSTDKKIHTRLHWDSFLTEMYMVFLFYFAWISSLPYFIIILFPVSHWKQGVVKLTTFSSLLASWFVVRQIAVPPVALSAWILLFFGARLAWYSDPILLWYIHHWNVHDIFI